MQRSRRAGIEKSSGPDHEEIETWNFWIDRGGTFTDVIGISSSASVRIEKLLSENPDLYDDAGKEAIRRILALPPNEPIPPALLGEVRVGTTICTNALLERDGSKTVLIVNEGFKDALSIANQTRPDIFARRIIRPVNLFDSVIELPGRMGADGHELEPFDAARAELLLRQAFEAKVESCAILFMHSYKNPAHEDICAAIASRIGFRHISISSHIDPTIKFIPRGNTTVVNAYLSPILERYKSMFCRATFGRTNSERVFFMQSNGGLIAESQFQARDSLLSGPVGGLVGAVETASAISLNKIISFDMGGTSTDVSQYDGEYTRNEEYDVSGINIRSPALEVHTIAAGGGSLIRFDGYRLRVGPQSAGASPGPCCYGKGGPLTITDCNLLLGRIHEKDFPRIFGASADQSLDRKSVESAFDVLIQAPGLAKFSVAETAWGFIEIAVEKMSQAIRKITTQRGIDLKGYTLVSFGGAGGQHACLLAEKLAIERIMIHPYAGVLSALGIGLSPIKLHQAKSIRKSLSDYFSNLPSTYEKLVKVCNKRLARDHESISEKKISRRLELRYQGTDSSINLNYEPESDTLTDIERKFEIAHNKQFGFWHPEKTIFLESIQIEISGITDESRKFCERIGGIGGIAARSSDNLNSDTIDTSRRLFSKGNWHDAPVLSRKSLRYGELVEGPSIIIDPTSTIIIDPGWQAYIEHDCSIILDRIEKKDLPIKSELSGDARALVANPVLLELFNNRFMAIAENMGVVLQRTSQSINIKERLDFSCALFDKEGKLIANAPHMPVHLGSMSESVQAIRDKFQGDFSPGKSYAVNNPYCGGTHLPDITVVSPVYIEGECAPSFFTAARGHHADIGGTTPGSMPPFSNNIEEEGCLLDPLEISSEGRFHEVEILDLLTKAPFPARNPDQNIADLKAQLAATTRGSQAIISMVDEFGKEMVENYMHHVGNNAEEAVRDSIRSLKPGSFSLKTDCGAIIKVSIEPDPIRREARISFRGSSPSLANNLNAPRSVTRACVLYVFRTLVDDSIPLNDGCMRPIDLDIPQDSFLNAEYPSAVVAGNVETSQLIVDALYGALGIMSASQGTMNNLTFGNEQFQYYETICGGSGAGIDHDGTDAVHTHMTNSRLTDPEILEWRFPVLLRRFCIRPDSGGAGKYTGGNGAIREIEFLAPMQASILSGRRKEAPFGLQGGTNGARGKNILVRISGKILDLGSSAQIDLQPGDRLVIETPGGGGYGIF